MRRLLTVTMALGLVITAMNFTGIFAIFTDTATTGTNSEESGEQPRTADLQIAVDEFGNCTGATFTENLETGLFNATGLVPGNDSVTFSPFCLKNAGTAQLTVSVSAIDVVETETGCTGDESDAGDATCGTSGIGDGELGNVLTAEMVIQDCQGFNVGDIVRDTVEGLASTPGVLGTIEPGAVACIYANTFITNPGVVFTSEQLQQAQSDKVEWRFAFDGAAS